MKFATIVAQIAERFRARASAPVARGVLGGNLAALSPEQRELVPTLLPPPASGWVNEESRGPARHEDAEIYKLIFQLGGDHEPLVTDEERLRLRRIDLKLWKLDGRLKKMTITMIQSSRAEAIRREKLGAEEPGDADRRRPDFVALMVKRRRALNLRRNRLMDEARRPLGRIARRIQRAAAGVLPRLESEARAQHEGWGGTSANFQPPEVLRAVARTTTGPEKLAAITLLRPKHFLRKFGIELGNAKPVAERPEAKGEPK